MLRIHQNYEKRYIKADLREELKKSESLPHSTDKYLYVK